MQMGDALHEVYLADSRCTAFLNGELFLKGFLAVLSKLKGYKPEDLKGKRGKKPTTCSGMLYLDHHKSSYSKVFDKEHQLVELVPTMKTE